MLNVDVYAEVKDACESARVRTLARGTLRESGLMPIVKFYL